MVDYTVPLNYENQAIGQTPAQIKSTYDYAKALLQGSGQQPIHHWTQGVSNIVNALVGGNLDYKAAQAERVGLDKAMRDKNVSIPTQNYPATPVGVTAPFPAPLPGQTSFNDSPSSAGGQNTDVIDKVKKAIASNETGGEGDPYSALGVVIPKTGDRAHGKYQVMGNNIPEWTEAALGKRMTPDEFLKDKDAQEAVASHKLAEYISKYGPEGAAKAWFAGEKGMRNPNAADPLGTTVDSYGKKFANAFAGPDDFSKSPAVAAMSSALRGGPSDAGDTGVQVAGGKTVPTGAPVPPPTNLARPDPSGGQTLINPALIKQQPGYTPSQLHSITANPFTSDADRQAAYQMMLQRGQTVEMKSPTGMGTVLVDPNDPRVQQYIAPAPYVGQKEVSETGIKQPLIQVPDAHGVMHTISPVPASPAIGPRSEAPVAPAEGGTPSNGTPGTPTAENVPAAPVTAPDVPVQVASTDPAAGIAATVGKPTVPAVAAPGAVGPLAQAMKTAPPGVSQEDFDTIQGLKKAKLDAEAAQHQRINDMDVNKSAQEKSADLAIKKYDTLSGQAQAARKLMPNLDLAMALTNDPRFNSGILTGPQDLVQRLKAGLLGEQNANAPNEVFDKLMAGTVLDTMKTALSGLGQVRLAEIGLLTKANANRDNTAASNRAVLEISRRGVQKIDQIDSMGQQYMSGDEVHDPESGKVLLKANVGPDGNITQRRGLDAGFDKLARDFTLAHPSFTPAEIKEYEKIFDTGKTSGATGKTEERAADGTAPPPEVLKLLTKGVPTTFQNGQSWTLGDDGKPKRLK